MQKIYVIITTYYDAKDKQRLISTPIVAYGSKNEAESYVSKMRDDDKKDIENLTSLGILDKKWHIEEISLADMNDTLDARDRLESHWIEKRADNDWIDHICANCNYTENVHPDIKWKAPYCKECGCRMTNG